MRRYSGFLQNHGTTNQRARCHAGYNANRSFDNLAMCCGVARFSSISMVFSSIPRLPSSGYGENGQTITILIRSL